MQARWSDLTCRAGMPHQAVLSLDVVARADPSLAKSPQALPSTEVIEVCTVCEGPILKWEARIGVGEPAHAGCLYGPTTEIAKPAKMPERVEYAGRLRCINAGTLAAMLAEYDERPDERAPEHVWQIELVKIELDYRLRFA